MFRLTTEGTQRSSRGLAFILGWVLSASVMMAQAVPFSANGANATPIPGAGHDYVGLLSETVDPSSGAVSVSIPISTRPGRGITYPVIYYFNQAPFYLGTDVDNGSDTIRFLPSHPPGPASATWTETTSPYYVQGPPGGNTGNGPNMEGGLCGHAVSFTFTGLDNVSHNLTLQASAEPTDTPFTQPSATGCSPGGASGGGDGVVSASFTSPTQTVNAIQQWPIGGTTGSFNAANNYYVGSAGTVGAFTVTDQNGTTYFFHGSSGAVYEQTWMEPAYLIEDRNGNQINACGNTYCDTLGQPLGNGVAYTVTSSNSINVQYTVPWNLVHIVNSGNTTLCNTSNTNNVVSGTLPGEWTVSLSPGGPSYELYFGTYTDTAANSPSNPYGLINEIKYPNGGWVQYAYPAQLNGDVPSQMATFNGTLTNNSFPGCLYFYPTPQVSTRTVSYNGSAPAQTQSFSYQTTFPPVGSNGPANGNYDWTAKNTFVTTTDMVANSTYYTVYNYAPPSGSAVQFGTSGQVPVEQLVSYYAGSSSSSPLLETETKGWYDPFHIACDFKTFSNGSTGHFYIYDPTYKQVADDKEYDYGATGNPTSVCSNNSTTSLTFAPPNNPTREIITTFQGFTNNLGATWGEPSSVVTNYLGAKVAETDYTYDEYARFPLVAVSALNHDDANFPSGTPPGALSARGNPTTVTKVCLQGCSNSVFTYTYLDTGQLASATDPCGNALCADMTGSNHTTQYSYTDSWASGSPSSNTNAYVTKITDPLGHLTQYSYNFASGEIAFSTDENSGTTRYLYTDALLRLTDVFGPPALQNNGVAPHTHYVYVDGNTPSVSVTSPIGGTIVTTTDGVGHPVKQQTVIGSTVVQNVDKTYNGMGQVQSVSNPYVGTIGAVTQYFYDGLGRKTLQLQPDNATTTASLNGVTTSSYSSAQQWFYSGNIVTFADELNHQWVRTTDGLGRLTGVTEPGSLQTSYAYNGLDSLILATQNGVGGDTARDRTFSYDSLSRLLTSTNPETGMVCYGQWSSGNCVNGYDGNGNLQYKTDARGVVVNYMYDALNRLLSKTYTNDASGSLASCYQYDTLNGSATGANLIGRLTVEWTQKLASGAGCPSTEPSGAVTSRTLSAYDALGRVILETQCVGNSCTKAYSNSPTYTYDLAGNLTQYGNLVGTAQFTNGFDAAGRLSLVTDSWTGAQQVAPLYPGTLFSSPSYTAFGALSNATYGTGLALARTYDSRLRVTGEIDTGSPGSGPATPGKAIISITGGVQTK